MLPRVEHKGLDSPCDRLREPRIEVTLGLERPDETFAALGRKQLQKQRLGDGKYAGSMKVPLEFRRPGFWFQGHGLGTSCSPFKQEAGARGDWIRCSTRGLLVLPFKGFSGCDFPACWCHLLPGLEAPCHLGSKWAANGFRFLSNLGCNKAVQWGQVGLGQREGARADVWRRTGDLARHWALSPDSQSAPRS